MASPSAPAGLKRIARRAANFVDLQWSLIMDTLRRAAPIARGRLLDVGCGDKPYLEIFSPYVSEYIGVEHEASFHQTNSAQANSADRQRGPDVLYDGEHLPFGAAEFDTVICIQTLEHTPKPQQLVCELGRVLRPDGRLLLMAPFSFRLHEEPHDYFRYTPHGLGVLCKNAGLELERCEPLGGLWSLLGHKLNSYLAFNLTRAGSFAQDLDKLGHESKQRARPRYWLMPPVALTMACVSTAARVLDRVAADDTETLGFLVVARHSRASRSH
jgi:SAM-dependent methyltransferase